MIQSWPKLRNTEVMHLRDFLERFITTLRTLYFSCCLSLLIRPFQNAPRQCSSNIAWKILLQMPGTFRHLSPWHKYAFDSPCKTNPIFQIKRLNINLKITVIILFVNWKRIHTAPHYLTGFSRILKTFKGYMYMVDALQSSMHN